MVPTFKCPSCGRNMEFEVRVPNISVSGQTRDFFSCECGRFTSQVTENAGPQGDNTTEGIVDRYFVAWATRNSNDTAALGVRV